MTNCGILFFMTHPSVSYTLAQELFDTFQGNSDLLSTEEVRQSDVYVSPGHMTNVVGIEASGEKEGVRVYQRLSLGKTGLYYLSTTYGYPHGGYERRHITPSTEGGLDVLVDSFFVESFTKIIRNRTNEEPQETNRVMSADHPQEQGL